jgi:hypothetical protein
LDKRCVIADFYRELVKERDASHVNRKPSSVRFGSTAEISGSLDAISFA